MSRQPVCSGTRGSTEAWLAALEARRCLVRGCEELDLPLLPTEGEVCALCRSQSVLAIAIARATRGSQPVLQRYPYTEARRVDASKLLCRHYHRMLHSHFHAGAISLRLLQFTDRGTALVINSSAQCRDEIVDRCLEVRASIGEVIDESI